MKQMNIFEQFNNPVFGTHPDLLARRNDPNTSKESAKTVDTTNLERIVYEAIWSFGEIGCISDEILDLLPNHRYSSITARYASLLRKGLIEDTGKTKKGNSNRQQRIVRAV